MFGRKKKAVEISPEIEPEIKAETKTKTETEIETALDDAIDSAINRAMDETIAAPDGIEISNYAGLHNNTEAIRTLTRLFDVYQPGVIFSKPTTAGDHTVITASEVYVGMGLGFGEGSGNSEGSRDEGGGGGGGGASGGRPIAAIITGPTGVRVEPIVDVTKITLAFITMLGALFMAWRAMRRQSKGK